MQTTGLAGRRRIGATPGGRRGTVIALYAVTLLVSAALLFCVQPMLARFVLPLLLLLPPLLVLPIGVPHGWVAPQRCTRGGSEPWTDDYSDVLTALLGGTSRQTG